MTRASDLCPERTFACNYIPTPPFPLPKCSLSQHIQNYKILEIIVHTGAAFTIFGHSIFFFFFIDKSQLPHAYVYLLHADKPRLWAWYSRVFASRHSPTHLYKWFQQCCFTKQHSGTNHTWIKPKSWARKRTFSLLFPVSQHGSLLKFLVFWKMRYLHCSCPIRSANIHIFLCTHINIWT